MNGFLIVILIAVGAFAGAILRYLAGKAFNRAFPYGTLLVNLAGAAFLGLLTGIGMSAAVSLIIGTGFMGSLTTFSTFKVEKVEMLMKRRLVHFISYILITYIGGFGLAWIAYRLGLLI